MFVVTAVDDVSDSAGPGRKCMLRLIPLGDPRTPKAIAGRYVRFSNWEVAAFQDGGDAMRMIFGTPPRDACLVNLLNPNNRVEQVAAELNNQAVYIRRPEHEARRPL